MNKLALVLIVLAALFLTGCGEKYDKAWGVVGATSDLIGVFTDPVPIHFGEIEDVTNLENSKILNFVDGPNYEVEKNTSVESGDMVKIFKDDNGGYRAEVD